MQFRDMGRKTQMLRSEYVKAERDENGNLVKGTGRSKVVLLGSFPYHITDIQKIDSSLIEKLTDEEREELKEHLSKVDARMLEHRVKMAPGKIVEKLDLLTEHYSGSNVEDEQIKAIKEGLSELLKARRAYKKAHK